MKVNRSTLVLTFAAAMVSLVGSVLAQAPREPFSGPQAGEKLPPLEVLDVFGEPAGARIDPVAKSQGKPLLLIFVHEITRPSVGLTRTLMDYVASREGIEGTVVFLTSDATDTENWMKRARHALPQGVLSGISPDGLEGPGAYGLNRNVSLTVLVGKEDRVTANFALVQPSIQADALRISAEIAKATGDEKAPTAVQLGIEAGGRDRADSSLRPLLAPLIRKTATEEEVDRAAAEVEKYLADNRLSRAQVGNIARRIVEAGRLENYGTPRAQHYLRKWAVEHGKMEPAERPKERKENPSETPENERHRGGDK